jgi:membrane fusion protein (multidrug efflux system)
VTAIIVQATDVAVGNEWVGTLDGNVNAQIQPQVGGYLVQQSYREGSPVTKGQVLFQIDPRPFEAALAQARGQIGQAEGQLAQAKAQLGLAKINVDRDTPLAEQHAISQSQLDNDKQQFSIAQANAQSATAAIASAQAAEATAKLNLGFTQVRSLISGVAGQATVQVGNLVNPQSVLTAVSQLDPIRMYFSVSDQEYLALTRRARQGHGDLLRGTGDVALTLTLTDGTVYPHKGRIAFVDRQMNQQTGAIRVAALFDNPGNVLRPGQFARLSADTEVIRKVLQIPQQAVMDMQGIKQVYTVGSDSKVHIANVTLGPQVGENWVVTDGVQPGVKVITDQLQKLAEGMVVQPRIEAPVAASHNPTAQTGR